MTHTPAALSPPPSPPPSPTPRICPDCGNDEHEPSADACWVCDCPLDAAPDPQRAFIKGIVRSDKVKRKGLANGSVGITTIVLISGLALVNPILAVAIAIAMAIAAKNRRKKGKIKDTSFIGVVLGVLRVLTIAFLLIAVAAVAGLFVLYLICMSSSGGHF